MMLMPNLPLVGKRQSRKKTSLHDKDADVSKKDQKKPRK